MTDIVTRLHIENIRSIGKAHLDLKGLSVLIGENGSGKSTVLEVCELLRRIPSGRFFEELYNIHSGHVGLLRQGQTRMSFGVRVEDTNGLEPALEYSLTLGMVGSTFRIEREILSVWGVDTSIGSTMLDRSLHGAKYFNVISESIEEIDDLTADELALSGLRNRKPVHMRPMGVDRLLQALGVIEVHLPFDSRPLWLARSQNQPSGMRDSVMLQPTLNLVRQGLNLPNVFHVLRDRGDWTETLELVRLGLGQDVESIQFPADPSGGRIGIAIKYRGLEHVVPAYYLSEGQLSYLALVAMLQLTPTTSRSLLCFDEPELHLHPGMIARMMEFFAKMGRKHTVLVSTHSDVLLNHLEDPASSVILCERNGGVSSFLRPSRDALKPWLEEYRGLGRALSEGAGEVVFEAIP